MESSSVQDFQRFHNRHSGAVTYKSTSRLASLQPHDAPIHSIEQDDDDAASLSGSAHHSSGPDELVFDPPISHHSSPRTSHHSDDNESISSFFSGSRDLSCPPENQPSSTYTPQKTRSAFRNPSSVRAMQMETTPPPYIPLSSSQQRGMFPISSRHGTPRSTRSAHSGVRMSPSKMSPTKCANVKKEYPLVLLHVTLLPSTHIYSVEVMEQILPGYILENWKILREKATDTVVERGILIPHPKDDYDLLEERLLESLDLKVPRILRCGHFHLDPGEEEDAAGSDGEDFDNEDKDADICEDCGRKVRDGKHGSGTGSRRWDIKVYAANGLMRAGAWGAAWREMERVDVEIIPWMDDDLKRELALRTEEERQHAALLQKDAKERGRPGSTMDEERMREIYGENIPTFAEEKKEQPQSSPQAQQPFPRAQEEIPLQELLKNYLLGAVQNRKNIAIFFLSIFVLFLSISASRSTPASLLPAHQPIVSTHPSSFSTASYRPTESPSVASIVDPSTVEDPKTPTTASTVEEDSGITPAPAQQTSMEDTADSIEARFEFAAE
ncbi:MAG: hypothetical protein Q9218_000507 [Villophora microphyllina]